MIICPCTQEKKTKTKRKKKKKRKKGSGSRRGLMYLLFEINDALSGELRLSFLYFPSFSVGSTLKKQNLFQKEQILSVRVDPFCNVCRPGKQT